MPVDGMGRPWKHAGPAGKGDSGKCPFRTGQVLDRDMPTGFSAGWRKAGEPQQVDGVL